jgi:hypothetical protein
MICIEGVESCGLDKPYRNKKYPPLVWDKVQTVKDYIGFQHRPRIPFEKKRIEELRYNTPTDYVLLYEDEKGPLVAKTYGGTSW